MCKYYIYLFIFTINVYKNKTLEKGLSYPSLKSLLKILLFLYVKAQNLDPVGGSQKQRPDFDNVLFFFGGW